MDKYELQWAERLRAFIANRRLIRASPVQEQLGALEKQQYKLILSQLQGEGKSFSRPTIFTSNSAGLVAIQRIYPVLPENLFVMYQDEYEQFSEEYRDEIMSRSYYHFWNYFEIWVPKEKAPLSEKLEAKIKLKEDSGFFKSVKEIARICQDIKQQGHIPCKQYQGWSGGCISGEGHSFIWRFDGEKLIFVRKSISWVS